MPWLLLLLAAGAAQASSTVLPAAGKARGGTFVLEWFTLDGGGGTATNGAVRGAGSIGQADASPTLSGGSFRVNGGYWTGQVPAQGPDLFSDGFESAPPTR